MKLPIEKVCAARRICGNIDTVAGGVILFEAVRQRRGSEGEK